MLINNKLKVQVRAIPMIPLRYVKKLEWSEELGGKLRAIRDRKRMSRQFIVERLPEITDKKKPKKLTAAWLAKMESGKTDTIDLDVILLLLNILGEGLESLYPITSVSSNPDTFTEW